MKWKSLLAACTVIILLVGATVALYSPPPPAHAEDRIGDDTYRLLDLFGTVFERVRRDYVEDISDQKLIEASINGMLTSLDPHSSYLNAKSFKEMQIKTHGEFGGLGIVVTIEGGLVKVVSPIDDTPAFRAGLKPGDFITHLNGTSVLGMTLQDAVDKMRGKVGTTVKLSVSRVNSDPFEVTLTRAVIEIETVRSERKGDVGYIRLTSFSEKTFDGLETAVDTLSETIGKDKIKGFVLDLRNNPGGLLDQAVAVSDAFLTSGEIVSTRSRHKEDTQRLNAHTGDLINGLPLIVLINDGSASASEIVAGALQDHRRAIIVGTKSFGKGSVQTIIPLTGHGAMRLTTARYYTPSGRSIQAVGIKPDIVVNQVSVSEATPGYHQVEADLRNALANDTVPQTGKASDTGRTNGSETLGQDGVLASASGGVKDYQLIRALDILRGIALYRERKTITP